MSQPRPTRRGVAQGLLVAIPGLLAGSRPAFGQTRRRGPWLITKTDFPPHLNAMRLSARQSAMATEAVLERSDIPEIRSYRTFLDTKGRRAKDGLAKLNAVNTYVNTHVKRVNDYDLYKTNEVWAPPVNTLTIGGDCEDIALVKYWGLLRLGFAEEDMFLVLGISTVKTPPEGHAVLGVRLQDGYVYVLDLLESSVIKATDLTRFEPAYAFNKVGFWQVDYADRRDGDAWRLQFQLTASGG